MQIITQKLIPNIQWVFRNMAPLRSNWSGPTGTFLHSSQQPTAMSCRPCLAFCTVIAAFMYQPDFMWVTKILAASLLEMSLKVFCIITPIAKYIKFWKPNWLQITLYTRIYKMFDGKSIHSKKAIQHCAITGRLPVTDYHNLSTFQLPPTIGNNYW